ncbi:MAG: aminotransferase class I/II-fold pyridoxal phosphate-dependent enzyme [Candidatus Omnitrophota bacterium]|nr:aminotransferase class I/II-fold pyridoxal phosphate-dependent enzyme [Candidatus Omnitrophota bacterium]
MKKLSKRVENIAPSGIRAFFDLVLGMKDVISLGVGEPDFTTPWNIREKAIYSLEQGFTTYTSNKGLLELRQRIALFLKHRHSLSYDPEQEILITVGVSEALDLALRAILNPGDAVFIPEPSYVSYWPVTYLAGGKPIYLPTSKETGFKITAQQISDKVKHNTKALILNYPSNPTGASYTKKELTDIAKVVLKKNLLVISDEVYDELTYDYSHTPFASLKAMKKNTIYLNGFSKSYAMTGFRLGFACGPKEVIAAMTKIHQYTMLCAPIISQLSGCEALKNGLKSVDQMKNEYKRRRDFIVDGLNNLGLDCFKPQGAFYVFPSIKKTGLSSLEFAQKLLRQEKVAVVPGTAFGPSGEGYIRISYAASFENIKEALSRLKDFLKSCQRS